MAYTFAELGKGIMARARENRFKSGRSNQPHICLSFRLLPPTEMRRARTADICSVLGLVWLRSDETSSFQNSARTPVVLGSNAATMVLLGRGKARVSKPSGRLGRHVFACRDIELNICLVKRIQTLSAPLDNFVRPRLGFYREFAASAKASTRSASAKASTRSASSAKASTRSAAPLLRRLPRRTPPTHRGRSLPRS